VDGADSFSLEGLSYYKRAGTNVSMPSLSLISEKVFPGQLDDKYDKVIYPINVLARRPITQIGAAEWLLGQGLPAAGLDRAVTLYWVGNNDSSTRRPPTLPSGYSAAGSPLERCYASDSAGPQRSVVSQLDSRHRQGPTGSTRYAMEN